jgi:hypothetical protein
METSVTVSSQASSKWIPLNIQQEDFKVSLGLEITGTGTYKVEHTFDNVQTDASPTAFTHSVLTGITSNTDSNYNFPVRAIRLTCTSFSSGSATLMIIQ